MVRIARNGQIHGPYTLEQVQQYLASGEIVATDLAQSDGMDEWLLVATLYPTPLAPATLYPGGLPALYPDPPNLPWWVALLLEIVTVGTFFVVWDIVEAAWMRRVERSSLALFLYIAAAILFLLSLPNSIHAFEYQFFDGPAVESSHAWLLSLTGWSVRFAARFVFRGELMAHFNRQEPIGMRLNWFLTLIFGGLYFQYHFNRICEVKRALHLNVPTI